MDNKALIEALRREIAQKEAEASRLRLLSKSAADPRIRAQCASQAKAAEAEADLLRRRLRIFEPDYDV